MFFVFKKGQIFLCLLLALTITFACFYSLAEKDKNTSLCLDFIESLGYNAKTKKPEVSVIKIPEGFGKVYENYNLLQNEAGYDLSHLRGNTVTRYSFPLKGEEDLIANILIFEGKICGGDIANISVYGKMLPLLPK